MQFGDEDDTQLQVPNQVFGQAVFTFGFDEDPLDGILGLGFTYYADNFVPPPVMNAIAQGLLDEPIFTVWLQTKVARNLYAFEKNISGEANEVALLMSELAVTDSFPFIEYAKRHS